jgi:hypothetical protein
MVFHLLTLRRFGAEKGTTGVEKVETGKVEVAIDQEVFLLRAACGFYARCV